MTESKDGRSGKALTNHETMNPRLLDRLTDVPSGNHTEILAKIRQGLPYTVIDTLALEYAAPRKTLTDILCISAAKLGRRRKAGRLTAIESDRVARLAHIKDLVVMMMQGSDEAAVSWLHTPQALLNGESPMDHLDTELGARDVETLVGRIRHGVFS